MRCNSCFPKKLYEMQKQKIIPAHEIQIYKEMKLAVDSIIPYEFLKFSDMTKYEQNISLHFFNILGYTPIT